MGRLKTGTPRGLTQDNGFLKDRASDAGTILLFRSLTAQRRLQTHEIHVYNIYKSWKLAW